MTSHQNLGVSLPQFATFIFFFSNHHAIVFHITTSYSKPATPAVASL
jgi:hypothetical protein